MRVQKKTARLQKEAVRMAVNYYIKTELEYLKSISEIKKNNKKSNQDIITVPITEQVKKIPQNLKLPSEENGLIERIFDYYNNNNENEKMTTTNKEKTYYEIQFKNSLLNSTKYNLIHFTSEDNLISRFFYEIKEKKIFSYNKLENYKKTVSEIMSKTDYMFHTLERAVSNADFLMFNIIWRKYFNEKRKRDLCQRGG